MKRYLLSTLLLSAVAIAMAADSWKDEVPTASRERVNPLAQDKDAALVGNKLYREHCASCHGKDGAGTGKKPSLRSASVQSASDGELFWLLSNGRIRKGMPDWRKLPEAQRWQIVSYLKALPQPKQ